MSCGPPPLAMNSRLRRSSYCSRRTSSIERPLVNSPLKCRTGSKSLMGLAASLADGVLGTFPAECLLLVGPA